MLHTSIRICFDLRMPADNEPQQPPVKEFLSTQECADWLGVPRYTVEREAREGRLPARKVGRAWRFSRSAILEHFRGSDAHPHRHPPHDPDSQRLDASRP